MKLYKFEKSHEMFKKAFNVIPSGIYGHQGPSEGCYIPNNVFPMFSEHAKGSKFWDLDGNEFIDYMCVEFLFLICYTYITKIIEQPRLFSLLRNENIV